MDRDGVEVNKLVNKERGQYPAILTYPLRKISLSQKAQKFTQNRRILLMVISAEILRRLKRDRDIGRIRKVVLSDVKTAFMCTPLSEN